MSVSKIEEWKVQAALEADLGSSGVISQQHIVALVLMQ